MDAEKTRTRLSEFAEKLETNILAFVNPINADEEKAKFFAALKAHQIYNPVFQYIPKNPLIYYFSISPEYEAIIKELKSLETDSSVLGRLLEAKKSRILQKIFLVKNIGGLDFTNASSSIYGTPDRKTIRAAHELVQLKESGDKLGISALKAKEFLQKHVDSTGTGFNVVIDENLSANAAIFSSEKKLAIKNRKYSRHGLKRLLFHEIQTHLYRFANGLAQPFGIFSSGTSGNWVATEEGLAAKNEEIFGVLSNSVQRNYAGRALALEFGLKHSFFETFRYLQGFFDDETSYYLTQRVKRGLVKTERPGAFTKDFVYLKGKLMLDSFVEKGRSLKDLYYGKIALDELPLLEKIDSLKKPKHLPAYKVTKH